MPIPGVPAGVQWIQQPSDVEQLMEFSRQKPVLLFKHSHTCGISLAALEELQAYMESPDCPADLEVFLVRVVEERPLSLALAERLGVRHQSPQAILIHNGEALWHTSHYSITRQSLHKAIQPHFAA